LSKNNNNIENRIKENLSKGKAEMLEDLLITPTEFTLFQNYPNPFNPSTTIGFYLPKDDFVRVNIYDYMGQLVKTLYSDNLSFGNNSFVWDGSNSSKAIMSSGIYICTVEITGKVFSQKMILQK
ncbi:MAG TPA: hypothetical protein DCE80_18370, partial [Ignavibacteriales bacterium]|nr:hypothetical protein [Ignavibacteriales bacterium]